MIKANFNTYNNYVTDSLYQWDLNQDLIINGLNLSVAPEIHFANANMDRAIVRQSTLSSGVVTVRIPNSLLQEALTIKAYVGVYEDTTFTVIETIEIPVIAKDRPVDYQIQDSDEEIYSFKRLENEIVNAKKNIADQCDDNLVEMQASIEMKTKTLSAQVANIIAHNNDTEGNTELLDIRIGANGDTFNSAGEAVRGQFKAINHKLRGNFSNVPLELFPGKKYHITTGVFETDSTTIATNKISVSPGDIIKVSLRCGQYVACVALFDIEDNYIGKISAVENFEIWKEKEIVIPVGAYSIGLTGFPSDEVTIQVLHADRLRNLDDAIKANAENIEETVKDIDEIGKYVQIPIDLNPTIRYFDVNKTSTFTELEPGYVHIEYDKPSVNTDVVGLEFTIDETIIDENSDKKICFDVVTDSPLPVVVYCYRGSKWVKNFSLKDGKFIIDLAHEAVYSTYVSNRYVFAIINPNDYPNFDLKVVPSMDRLIDNPYRSDGVVGTLNNIGEDLASLRSQFTGNRTTILVSPNGTEFKVRVANDGTLRATSLTKTIKYALFCGNSLLLSNGGSGMSASSPENDYFAHISKFLQERNPEYIYHVWKDQIDGTETAVKADNFAGVFENLTTVKQVEDFLPTMDKYFTTNIPDYISIQLGDNSAQNVDFFTGEALPMLIDYCQKKAPNALIVVMGAWYTTASLLAGIASACAKYDVIFVNFKPCRSTETENEVGATVIYPDRSEHTITSTGVASHPNDLGFKMIADMVIEAISPYVNTVNQ